MNKRKQLQTLADAANDPSVKRANVAKDLCEMADETNRKALVAEMVEECEKSAKEGGYGRNFYPRCFKDGRKRAVFTKNVERTLADFAAMKLPAKYEVSPYAKECKGFNCENCSHYSFTFEWYDANKEEEKKEN